jgi:hypothetical protein
MSSDWRQQERDLAGVGRELCRVVLRAWARPLLTVCIACATAVAGAVYVTMPRPVPVQAVVRVTEGTLSSGREMLSRKDLEHYIADVALSSTNLGAVVDEHRLYPRARSADEAADELRRDLRIEVFHNYFEVDRGEAGGSRSARARITFRHLDPDVAEAVATDLARLVVEVGARRGRAQVERVLAEAEVALEAAAAALGADERALFEQMSLRGRGSPGDLARPEAGVVRTGGPLSAQRELLRQIGQARTDAELRTSDGELMFGVRFESAGIRRPPPVVAPRQRFVVLALALFALTLPLCAMGVGAFDPTVRNLEDLRRVGVEAVGQLSEQWRFKP